MKNIILTVIAVLLCLGVLYFTFFVPKQDETTKDDTVVVLTKKDKARVEEVSKQIDENKALSTYINNVELYKELMELDPQNIDWYLGLADTYKSLNDPYKYKRACQRVATNFPDDVRGHLMLIEYYAARENEKYVLRTYRNVPDTIKSDANILSIYEKYEWYHRMRGGRCDEIVGYGGNSFVRYNGESYGYLNDSLYSGLSYQYTLARPFIEDKAAVYKNNEWYFIDKSGYRVLASYEKIDDLYSFSEGYAVASIDGTYGFVDDKFEKHNFEYEDATSLFNEVAAVKKNGKWALVDKEFNPITNFEFDDVIRDEANVCSRFKGIWLKSNGLYYLYDTTGTLVSENGYEDASLFYSSCAVAKKDGKWGVVDRQGEVFLDFVYSNASSCASDMVAVEIDGKWGCIDLEGNTVLEFVYDYAVIPANNGVVAVKTGDVYRFVKFYKYE